MSKADQEPESYEAPPARFRGAGDDDDAPLNTSRGALFKWSVWIFGVGGGLLFVLGSMQMYLPTGGGSRAPAVTEADFETHSVTGTYRGHTVRLTAPVTQTRPADLEAHLALALTRMADLGDELLADGGPGGGVDAINARAGESAPVRVRRPLRQAVEMAQEISATVGLENAFVSLTDAGPEGGAGGPSEPSGAQEEEPADEAEEPALEAAPEAEDAGAASNASDEAAHRAPAAAPGPRALPSGRLLAYDEDTVALLHPGTRLDLGAVALGRIVDLTVASLQDEGLRTFALSLGDVTFYSGDFGGFPWVVAADAPDDAGRVELLVSGRAVVRMDGEGPLARVVVVGGRADRAAGLAHVILDRDLEEARRAADRTVGTDVIFFPATGGAQMTPGMSSYLPMR